MKTINKDYILNYLQDHKKELYQTYGIEKIGLFGSFATEQFNSDSDIDLTYHLDGSGKFGFHQLIELENKLGKDLKREIELINYKYMNPIIKVNAKKNLIYV
jgi:uncharacterized protein